MAIFQSLTIRQIAEKANVSTATVSRAINKTGPVKQATLDRINAAISELGCTPALEPLSSVKKSNIILVSFPDMNNPFNSPVIQGIMNAAARRGYRVVIFVNENYTLDSASQFYLDAANSFDGLILAHTLPDHQVSLLARRFPVVMCSEHIANAAVPYVAIDDHAAACTAMDYLISSGRKKIALVNSSLSNNYAIHRERGYRDSLAKANIPANERWILHLPDVSYDAAVGSVAALFEGPDRPDACFCVSDVFAASVIKAATERGISIPRDMSVVGFDDIDLATMTVPTITTIQQPAYQLGWQSCNILIEQIENPGAHLNRIILKTDLIVRGST